jgi:hypothetical protein
MKTLKMNLENIQGKMNRMEMRNILGGDNTGSTGGGGDPICICNNTDYGRMPQQVCFMLCSV